MATRSQMLELERIPHLERRLISCATLLQDLEDYLDADESAAARQLRERIRATFTICASTSKED